MFRKLAQVAGIEVALLVFAVGGGVAGVPRTVIVEEFGATW